MQSSAARAVHVTLSNWTKPPRLYAFQPGGAALKDTGLQPPGKYDDLEMVTTVVQVRSHDGVLVPLSIIHRRNIELDGSNRTLLNGYGAYGLSYDDAFQRFDPLYLAWLDTGGVVAIAHVRGGGEYGEEWHMAGFKQTKPNTWKDFIAHEMSTLVHIKDKENYPAVLLSFILWQLGVKDFQPNVEHARGRPEAGGE